MKCIFFKKGREKPLTFPSYLIENRIISFGFGSTAGLSFADLASKGSGDFAFGSKGELN